MKSVTRYKLHIARSQISECLMKECVQSNLFWQLVTLLMLFPITVDLDRRGLSHNNLWKMQ